VGVSSVIIWGRLEQDSLHSVVSGQKTKAMLCTFFGLFQSEFFLLLAGFSTICSSVFAMFHYLHCFMIFWRLFDSYYVFHFERKLLTFVAEPQKKNMCQK